MSSEDPDERARREYEVGYGRPPAAHQFKPGQSGNPKGRPKGTRNLKTDLTEELSEKVSIREGDRNLKVSKQRLFVKSLMARALKGDVRAMSLASSLMLRLLADQSEAQPDEPLLPEEEELLDLLAARAARHPKRKSEENDADE